MNQKESKIKELTSLVENLRFQLNEIAEMESSNGRENPDERTRSLEEQVVNLKNHIEECEAKEQNLLTEIERLKREENEEIESLKEQCQLLEDRQDKLREENESLNSNIDEYASQLLKSQEAVVVLKHQLVVLDEQLQEEQHRPAPPQDGACCEVKQKEIEVLSDQLEDLKKELAVYEEKLSDVSAENKVLSKNNEVLINEVAEQKTSFSQEKEALKQEIRSLNGRIRTKETQLRDLTREFSPDAEKTNSPRRVQSIRQTKSRSRSPLIGRGHSSAKSPSMEIDGEAATANNVAAESFKEKIIKEFEMREAKLMRESADAIIDLTAQVKSLEAKIELCQLKETSIMERVHELETREKDLMDQLKNYRLSPSEVEHLKEELDGVKEEKAGLLKRVGELDAFLAETNAKFFKSIEEREAAEAKLRLIENKLSLMEESEELNSERIGELEKSQIEIMEVSQENVELKEEVETMKRRVDELESIRQSLQDQLWEFHQIERDLKDEIHQMNANQVDKDALKEMDERIGLLQISERNLTTKNKNLEKTEHMLRARLAPIEHLDPKMIVKMKNQILSLEKADKHLKKYIRELEDSQKCLGSENKELLVETDRLRETVAELRHTETQLVDKIFELEAIESHLQRALVEKDYRGWGGDENTADNADQCEKLNNEILKMQYESSILIFEATMKEKDLVLEHERGVARCSIIENESLKSQVDSLQSDLQQLRVDDEKVQLQQQKKLKEVEEDNHRLVGEVQTLRSSNEELFEKEEQLQSTLQKMEESLHKSNVNAELEKEKAAVLESQLDEKAQLISEIQVGYEEVV